ncbi:DUF3135 domain-containing protein [Patescibacteria group bacterium]
MTISKKEPEQLIDYLSELHNTEPVRFEQKAHILIKECLKDAHPEWQKNLTELQRKINHAHVSKSNDLVLGGEFGNLVELRNAKPIDFEKRMRTDILDCIESAPVEYQQSLAMTQNRIDEVWVNNIKQVEFLNKIDSKSVDKIKLTFTKVFIKTIESNSRLKLKALQSRINIYLSRYVHPLSRAAAMNTFMREEILNLEDLNEKFPNEVECPKTVENEVSTERLDTVVPFVKKKK